MPEPHHERRLRKAELRDDIREGLADFGDAISGHVESPSKSERVGASGYWFLGQSSPDHVSEFEDLRQAISAASTSQHAVLRAWASAWKKLPHAMIEGVVPIDGLAFSYAIGEADIPVVSVSMSRGDPVVALFAALGPSRALRLPGFLGNIALTRDEVPAALATVNEVFAMEAPERDAALERFLTYRNAHTTEDELDGESVFELLPNALARVAALGCGFVAYTFSC